MKKVLAISGGVDSMAMLDFCAKFYACDEIIVAHLDHRMRENSHEDLEFVKRAAEARGMKFVSEKAAEGICKSEESARKMRYGFLRKIARENNAEIFTAHHLDDLMETVAINFLRGTGWRGLAVLDAPNTRRIFLETEKFFEPMDKAAIWEYAAKCGVRFREDQTNSSEEYLRNRVREKLGGKIFEDAEEQGSKCEKCGSKIFTFEEKLELYELWRKQKILKREIDKIVQEILPAEGEKWQRKWFRDLEEKAALEILRAGTLRAGISATRPQLLDFRKAILDYAPGKKFNLPGGKLVKLTKDEFEL